MPAKSQTFVKICGITRLVDARSAIRAGANAIGFVFAKSPRHISPSKARRIAGHVHPSMRKVGVFVDSPVDRVLEVVGEVGLDAVQLQGEEPPEMIEELRDRDPSLFIAKVVKVTDRSSVSRAASFAADAVFFDTKDPHHLEEKSAPVPAKWLADVPVDKFVVAGGLNPRNVSRVVRSIKPWGVDVSSGVEISPGVKDPAQIKAFVAAVRRAESHP